MTTNEAPRYRVKELSWLNLTLTGEGREVTYLGVPGSNLEPLNDAARDAVEKAGNRPAPGIPLLPEPSAPPMPVDWQALAVANGWAPAAPVQPADVAQAPQPAPVAGAAKGGGAAAKLNAASTESKPADSADI